MKHVMIFLLLGVCWALCKITLLSCGQKDKRASVTPSVTANLERVWLARFPQHPNTPEVCPRHPSILIPLKYAPGITLSSPLEKSRRLVPASEIGVAWAQSCEGRILVFSSVSFVPVLLTQRNEKLVSLSFSPPPGCNWWDEKWVFMRDERP